MPAGVALTVCNSSLAPYGDLRLIVEARRRIARTRRIAHGRPTDPITRSILRRRFASAVDRARARPLLRDFRFTSGEFPSAISFPTDVGNWPLM